MHLYLNRTTTSQVRELHLSSQNRLLKSGHFNEHRCRAMSIWQPESHETKPVIESNSVSLSVQIYALDIQAGTNMSCNENKKLSQKNPTDAHPLSRNLHAEHHETDTAHLTRQTLLNEG